MWIEIASTDELTKRKRIVVTHGDEEILVLAHEGRFHAMANKCIHRDRELLKGVVLRGRLVCPGHQWAFDLGTGWESVKLECQPVFDVRVVDGMVAVDPESRRTLDAPSPPVAEAPATD